VPYAQWLHIVTTHADGRVVLYVNGESAGDATYATGAPGFEFFMYEPAYHIGWATAAADTTAATSAPSGCMPRR
jgi:hypothetical protein